MAETVKRYREPVAWVVLGVSVVYIVMSLVRGGYLLSTGVTLPHAARTIGGSSLSIVMVLLCLAASLACVLIRPATPKGHGIVRFAAAVVTTAALLELVFLVMGLFDARGGLFGYVLEVLGGILEIAVKLAAAQLLWGAARSTQGPLDKLGERGGSLGDRGNGSGDRANASGEQAKPVEEPRQQASWKAEQAAGAVWTRAGDAASGAAATTWGHPGQQASGWNVAPTGVPELPSAEPATKGPWATAGELATGEAPETAPRNAPDKATGGTGVSWEPARRDS